MPTHKPRRWPRVLLSILFQLPALAYWGQGDAAHWTAGLWGSAVCCLSTDSGWRWTNLLWIAAAALWLLWPLLVA
jgi:hypothetical protein